MCCFTALERDIENRISEEEKSVGVGGKNMKTRRQRNQRRTSASDGGTSSAVVAGAGHGGGAAVTRQFSGEAGVRRPADLGHAHPAPAADHQLVRILLLLLGFLCILNLFLVFKMWSLESKISVRSESLSSYQLLKLESARSAGDWVELLQRQESLHTQELDNWRLAVEAASSMLQQTERSMQGLARTFNTEVTSQILKSLLKLETDTYKKAVLNHVIDKEL